MALYDLIRPLLFRLDAEKVHNRAIAAAQMLAAVPFLKDGVRRIYRVRDPRLECEVCGLRFSNPVGLAAGYDKSGRAIEWMAALGFGFIEIGSVSADPSDGNPRPRLFRLPRDRAIVVNYGLQNDGAQAVAARIGPVKLPVPLGINIVKTNRLCVEPDEAILEDYVRSVALLKEAGDYHILNLSCPNTETGRDFFADPGHMTELLRRLAEQDLRCPLLLKVSPLGGAGAIERLLESVDPFPQVSGFAFNLPPGKPVPLSVSDEELARMAGAVSGKPVEGLINTAIKELYRRMDRDRYRIIGVGGVFTAEDAYLKIRLGASLVQLLTALVYRGPGIVKRINRGLARLLERDGFANVQDAVGIDIR